MLAVFHYALIWVPALIGGIICGLVTFDHEFPNSKFSQLLDYVAPRPIRCGIPKSQRDEHFAWLERRLGLAWGEDGLLLPGYPLDASHPTADPDLIAKNLGSEPASLKHELKVYPEPPLGITECDWNKHEWRPVPNDSCYFFCWRCGTLGTHRTGGGILPERIAASENCSYLGHIFTDDMYCDRCGGPWY